MRIRLTNPEMLDDVLVRLNEACPFGECNDNFLKYCVPSIKEKLAKGETVFLETEIGNIDYRICQILSYWTLDNIPADEEYLNSDKYNGNE